MNTTFKRDPVFMPAGVPDRSHLRAPRLLADIRATPGVVMGNRAFLRAWAARRAAILAAHTTTGRGSSSIGLPANNPPAVTEAP